MARLRLTNSASHFEPADHLRLDGSDSPDSPATVPPHLPSSAGEHGRVGHEFESVQQKLRSNCQEPPRAPELPTLKA